MSEEETMEEILHQEVVLDVPDVKWVIQVELLDGKVFELDATVVQIGQSEYQGQRTGLKDALTVFLYTQRGQATQNNPRGRRILLRQTGFNWADVRYYMMEPKR